MALTYRNQNFLNQQTDKEVQHLVDAYLVREMWTQNTFEL